MRISIFLALMVLAGCVPFGSGPGRASGGMELNIQLGPERPVSMYSMDRHGDWRANYQQWQPATLYVIDGRFYERETRGARAVVVYRRDNEYFLPPQDREWVGADRRIDYKNKPRDEDYNRRPDRP